MSRLCSSLHPLLTQDAVERLFKRKLYSVLSFVQCNPEVIARISRLQYTDVLIIKSAILTKFSSPLLTGEKLFDEVFQQGAIVHTGIQNFDKLLGGGFMTGNIYELCGATGSGKTQMCMTIAANIVTKFEEQIVLYIDTKNDVSSQRIREIVEKKTNDISNHMNRIKICGIYKATQLISLLHKLIKDFDSSENKTLGFRIIIIDSISSIFFRFLGDDANTGLVHLNKLSNLLRYIAVEYHIVILVTNLVTNWTVEAENGEQEEEPEAANTLQEVQTPVLGKYWSHVPCMRVSVKKLDNSEKWLLVIMKSTDKPAGKAVNVTISKAGVS